MEIRDQAKKGEKVAVCSHALKEFETHGSWGTYAWYQIGEDASGATLVIPHPKGKTPPQRHKVQWIALCDACCKKYGKHPQMVPIIAIVTLTEDGPVITDPDLN